LGHEWQPGTGEFFAVVDVVDLCRWLRPNAHVADDRHVQQRAGVVECDDDWRAIDNDVELSHELLRLQVELADDRRRSLMS
jgi:hypothetical protein